MLNPKPLAPSVYVYVPEAPFPHERSILVMYLFPSPDLILPDLNLPGKDGREVLAEIKADEGLKHIPVVIPTSSQDEEDILRSYLLHANCYISKPVRLAEFVKVVKSVECFWFTIVALPRNEP